MGAAPAPRLCHRLGGAEGLVETVGAASSLSQTKNYD
jgi:hypothetical protein